MFSIASVLGFVACVGYGLVQSSAEHLQRHPPEKGARILKTFAEFLLSSDAAAGFNPSAIGRFSSVAAHPAPREMQTGFHRSMRALSMNDEMDSSDEVIRVDTAPTASPPLPSETTDPRHAVVMIFNLEQQPMVTVPWQSSNMNQGTGSGAVILHNGKKHILTAAHVVSDSRYLQIQRSMDRFSGEKFMARVAGMCHDADLALLAVEDPRALDGIKPLELASSTELPQVFEKVRVVGYPVGGTAVSVTEGVVSRIEMRDYTHSLRPALALTVDAAINSGNSGGPLLNVETSQIIGVAFQKLVAKGVELQGHAVPAPIIHQFLKQVDVGDNGEKKPVFVEMPSLGIEYQILQSPVLRESLGLSADQHGVLISRVHYTDEAPPIQVGDVMLSFDGVDIDDQGFCLTMGRRLQFSAIRDLKPVGASVELKLFRNGQEIVVQQTLKPTQFFVPRSQFDVIPKYYVVGGLVFQVLTQPFLQLFPQGGSPIHLDNLFRNGHITPERTEAVILNQIFADNANQGYNSGWMNGPIVSTLNGIGVKNMDHFVELVRAARKEYKTSGKGDYLNIEMDTGSDRRSVVLRIADLEESDLRIRQNYGVPVPCSVHYMAGLEQ